MNQLFSSQPKRSRKRKGSRKQNALVNQRPKPGYSYSVQNGPRTSPQMPKEFSVALTDRSLVAATASVVPVTRRWGLIEFLGDRPLYTAEFYTMYKYARVLSVHYHFEIINTGPGPIEVAFGIVPFTDAALSLTQLIEKPGSVRRLVSPLGGMDRATIDKFAVAQDWMGNPYNTRDYWVNAAQSTNTTPLDAEEPIGVLIVSPVNTTAITFSLSTKLVFNIQFFDLEVPALSLAQRKLDQIECDDESEDMVSVMIPKSNLSTKVHKK